MPEALDPPLARRVPAAQPVSVLLGAVDTDGTSTLCAVAQGTIAVTEPAPRADRNTP